jgi:hypothetical protein
MQPKTTYPPNSHLSRNGTLKNKLQNSGMFFAHKISHETHHQSPRIHHEFTTKTPRKNTQIAATPLKKACKNAKKAPAIAGTFFLQNLKN